MKIIAYQGEPGAYSEAAVFEHYLVFDQTLPCPSFEKVFESVESGKATHGLIPIENSLAGSIHRNYDLLLDHGLTITSEHHFRVSHCLLALSDVPLGDIKTAHSHPQALSQCRGNLARLGIESIIESDTAGSARMIKERGLRTAAAVASSRAAEVYGLKILKENLEDNPENYTRFLGLVKASEGKSDEMDGDYKTSIVFSLTNTPGALFKALSVFALRDIDLTKIESRPMVGKPFEYMFYIDFAGHMEESSNARAIDHLGEMAPFLRILGSYKRHRL